MLNVSCEVPSSGGSWSKLFVCLLHRKLCFNWICQCLLRAGCSGIFTLEYSVHGCRYMSGIYIMLGGKRDL